MSYFADHLAWQQRVNQEFKSQHHQAQEPQFEQDGKYYQYPDLVNYLKQPQGQSATLNDKARYFGQNTNVFTKGQIPSIDYMNLQKEYYEREPTRDSILKGTRSHSNVNAGYEQYQKMAQDVQSNYSYSGKRKAIYSRKDGQKVSRPTSVKSKLRSQIGSYQGENDTKSILSKQNMQRFNENDKQIMNGSKAGSQTGKSLKSRSQLNSAFGRANQQAEVDRKSQISNKNSVFSKASFMRKKQEMAMQFAEETAAAKTLDDVQVNEGLEAPEQEQFVNEEAEQEDLMTSVSQVIPTKSQISGMTGRTYISQLQAQLEEEKYARENLEQELTDLKKVSSEILSHLSEIKEHQANQN